MKTLEFYRDAQRKHRWRVFSSNGRVQATGAEGYNRIGKCIDAACAVLRVEMIGDKLFGYDYQIHAPGGAGFVEVMKLKMTK